MSHLNPIPERTCGRCTKRARYELVNDRSAVIGYYCAKCGLKALYEFQHPGIDDTMRIAGAAKSAQRTTGHIEQGAQVRGAAGAP